MPPRTPLSAEGELVSPEWSSGPVAVARSFRQRRKGLAPRPQSCGLLLSGRSVHTFTMTVPLLVVALDAGGQVLSHRVMPPRRIFTMWQARHMLELDHRHHPPPVGVVLTWRGAGTPDPLRHPDRQPR
jgi:hypothetical protein